MVSGLHVLYISFTVPWPNIDHHHGQQGYKRIRITHTLAPPIYQLKEDQSKYVIPYEEVKVRLYASR
jgi:hypothetical protein